MNRKQEVLEKVYEHCKNQEDMKFHNDTVKEISKTCGFGNPFVKWAGGKNQILPEIRKFYPQTISRYCEPFVGGGAALFDVMKNFDVKEILVNDINFELINTYKAIKNDAPSLVEILRQYKNEYINRDDDEKKNYFYQMRKRFNELKAKNSSDIEISALFIFLNKTCFNGLYRVNKNGEFNVPFNYVKNPLICDEKNLLTVSKKLQNVSINCGDYKMSENFIDGETFVYFDPPYRPLSKTASFTSYSQNDWTDSDQIELAFRLQSCEYFSKIVNLQNDGYTTKACIKTCSSFCKMNRWKKSKSLQIQTGE